VAGTTASLLGDLARSDLCRSAVRLLSAAVLGGAIGLERQIHGRYAGLRTHALVSVGAAAFLVVASSIAASAGADSLRVLQGVVIGVGFLGSGAILKLATRQRIEGLTTASGIWNAAAIGSAAGTGYIAIGVEITILVLVILWILRALERKAEGTRTSEADGEHR
jgi:putative Mg2+ transporter-C (MgtC) family protein